MGGGAFGLGQMSREGAFLDSVQQSEEVLRQKIRAEVDEYGRPVFGNAARGQVMLGGLVLNSPHAGQAVRLQEQTETAGKLLVTNGGVQAMAGDGSWFMVTGNQRDPAQVAALLNDLAERGTALMPNLPPHETGYWNPSVVTGEDGKATVSFELPDQSTGWSLLAKGVTKDTLAGEASHDLTVRKDLFGQLKTASAYTDGDKAQIVASVHNNAVDEGNIEVTL